MTSAGDDVDVPMLVLLILFQLCSVRLGVAAVAPANTSRNTELSRAAEFCCRVFKLRCARAVRTLILKGSDSQQRTTEIYVPSSNMSLRYFAIHTKPADPGISPTAPEAVGPDRMAPLFHPRCSAHESVHVGQDTRRMQLERAHRDRGRPVGVRT